MNIDVIKADYQDKKQAQEIALLLNAYASDPMGGGQPLTDDIQANIARELSRLPHAFSVIAYVDSRPAGLANCFEMFSTFLCKPLINIHDVVVLKQYRGMGLSHRLLEKIEQIAIERGCCKLTLEVLSGNTGAKVSYEKFGFKNYELDPALGQALFWQKLL